MAPLQQLRTVNLPDKGGQRIAHQVEVRHVADALDFSKANFYHHVDSKEELLYGIFIDTLRYSLGHLEEIVASDQSMPDQPRALVAFMYR